MKKRYIYRLIVWISLTLLGAIALYYIAEAIITLPPSTQKGAILVASTTSRMFNLATGTQGYVLTMDSGLPIWKIAKIGRAHV